MIGGGGVHRPFNLVNGIVLSALITLAGAAQAATFVYVSNAEDGDIGVYTMDGRWHTEARQSVSRRASR